MTNSRQRESGQADADRSEAIARLREIPDWSVGQYLSNLYELSLPVDGSVVTSFTDRITELVAQVCAVTMACPLLAQAHACMPGIVTGSSLVASSGIHTIVKVATIVRGAKLEI